MKYSNYQECIKHITELSEFRSNSLHGEWGVDGFYVISYRTVIGFISTDRSSAYVNAEKYSVTTSKHQTYLRQALRALQEQYPHLNVVEHVYGIKVEKVTA